MAIAGQIEYKVTVDTSGLKSGLNEAKKEASGFSSFLGNAGKTGAKLLGSTIKAGAIASTGAIVGLVKSATQSFADYEQLVGGVETLFKDSSEQVFQYADQAYKTAGLSANEYMEQATSFASRLIRDTGGDTARASELVNLAITDMADNANKMGTSIEAIQHAYEGLSKGNATMLDNLKVGYGGTQTEMLKLAKDMGVVDENVKSFNDISFEDAILAIHKVQDRLGITGTTAKEAEATISGSAAMVKASWQNLMTGLADDTQDFDKLLDNFIDSIGKFGENIIPTIKVAMKGVVNLIQKLGPQIIQAIPPLLKDLLPPLIEATVMIFVELVKMLPDLMPILVDGLILLITTLVPYIPTILGALFQAIIQSIGALLSSIANRIFPWLGELMTGLATKLGEWFMNLGASISTFFGDFAQKALEAIDGFVQGFRNGIQAIKDWFASIPAFFAGVIGKISDKVKQFGAKVGEVVGGAFKAVVNGVLSFIEGFINTPIKAINGLIDVINAVPGIDLGRLNEFHLPRLAKGGLATDSTLANIGEAGDEAVIPLERNTASWAGPLARAIADQFEEQNIGGASGITVYMTNNINNNLDADEIGQRLMTSIRRAS